MGPRTIWKRAAALLAAAGLLATLSASVSADENNIGSEAARALQPTEIRADIPEEYHVLFPLEWGGGSLLHLKGRLATMGCTANNIWLYDNDKWSIYNQYDLPSDTFFIQRFKQQYEQFIPAGSLWADCYNICDISDEGCLSFRQLQEQEDNFNAVFYAVGSLWSINFELDKDVVCDDGFHP